MTLEQLECDLQRLCTGVLRLNSLGVSDNLLGKGADSLSIISMLLEINERYDIELPAAALFRTPTIGGLARFILEGYGGAEGKAGGLPQSQAVSEPVASPQIRPAGPSDIESICQLLYEGFGKSISPDTWRRLFDYNWIEEKPTLGFVAVDEQEIVGFIGTVYSKREKNGKTGIVCNLSSWYVRPQYRSWSLPLLAAAVQDETISYTALTPAEITVRALKAMGFSTLSAGTILFPPLLNIDTFRGPAPVVTFDPERIVRLLNNEQLKIFRNHRQPDCLHAAVIDKENYCYIIVKRRTLRWRWLGIGYSDVLHCSAPDLLERHLERVKLAVLRRQKTLGLSVYEASVPQLHSLGIPKTGKALFRSPVFADSELDRLYSELSLLPIPEFLTVLAR